MSTIRRAAVALGNTIPRRWKRALKWQLMIPDAGASLELLKRKGFVPRYVLDIGSYVGTWTEMCKEIWPSAQVCMFEPQPQKRPGLERLAQSMPGIMLRTELLGDSSGREVAFHLAETGSSTLELLTGPTDVGTIMLHTQTLSSVLAGTPFARPDLVKVDVQGAELQVLDGGQDVLQAAEVVMLEVSLIEEYRGSPLFADVVAYMAQKGFLVHDICTIFRNTPDQSMNEADVIFVRKGSSLAL
jgi:FkbM family methyltransferase